MIRAWPDTLPGVIVPGYQLSPVDQSIRTEMEAGLPRNRRITAARGDTLKVVWKFTDAEFVAFRAWHGDEAWSLTGDSDAFAAWSTKEVSLVPDAAVGPAGQLADRIVETAATAQHRILHTMPEVLDGQEVTVTASLKAAGRTLARVGVLDRASALLWADVDLETGAVLAQNGLTTTAHTEDRGAGFWRVIAGANVGTGALDPQVRIFLKKDTGDVTYAGDGVSAIDLCEVNARVKTGYDLCLPTDASGNLRGAAGGAAWVEMPLAFGGALRRVEARFTGRYEATLLPGLNWRVSAPLEVRNA